MTSLTPDHPLWIGDKPLLLASKSAPRRALLAAAGLPFEAHAADIDERALEADYLRRGEPIEALAMALARAKALEVSARRPGALTLGADQTLLFEGRLLHKSATFDEAAASLAAMNGRTHRLICAFALARAGRILAEDSDVADLTMRALDAGQIARYLAAAGPGVLASVGAYQLEGLGAHLFDRIQGEHSVILGLPMLKLLAALRGLGMLAL
ncbi:MAG: septum formation inhibitor Maf [Bradyrhizobium sp.]|nr:MAG: septum formation inhibitor Maf [Bradyrhizobium sp.]